MKLLISTGSKRGRMAVTLSLSTLALSGCYVVQTGQDRNGNPYYVYSTAPVIPAQAAPGATPVPVIGPGGPASATLSVKLYPVNDLANQTGILTGQVINSMNGKGRFTFNYQGETLVGEATRVSNDERRGVASAYGARGIFARCEYQMSNPSLGAGSCTFSNGAQYQLHVGG